MKTETVKRKRGRPRKKPDAILPWQFVREGMLMSAYDEARESGEKHIVAVQYAVDFVKQHMPGMPISKTEVKRVLAARRPLGSSTILRFERSSPAPDHFERIRRMLEQVPMEERVTGLAAPLLPRQDRLGSGLVFKFRFAERPDYPRHNRKTPKE